MGRPRLFENRKQITFSLSESEYKWVELQAGGNVSAWCREQVLEEFNGAKPRRVEAVQRREAYKARTGTVDVPTTAEMPTVPNPSRRVNCVCGHPKIKHGGFNGCCQENVCQCGGYREAV